MTEVASSSHPALRAPRIVITVQAPFRADDPAVAEQKNRRYLESVRRHGGEPIALDELTSEADRATAFSEMDGLLLSGGADVAPAYYGEEPDPTTVVEPERDRLEESAFRAAEARSVPVFGICRGMQAINVFRGGGLVQDIGGHTSEAYPAPTRHVHPLTIAADSRLGHLVTEMTPSVNTYHHQAVPPDRLGAGLRIAGTSPHDDGDLVEAIEDTDPDRWLVGVQSHPERTESTPEAFENLWQDFISAARRFAEGDQITGASRSGITAKG